MQEDYLPMTGSNRSRRTETFLDLACPVKPLAVRQVIASRIAGNLGLFQGLQLSQARTLDVATWSLAFPKNNLTERRWQNQSVSIRRNEGR